MTQTEKASLLKTWTFIVSAVGILGLVGGWGISAGINANRQSNLIAVQDKHEVKLIEHERELKALQIVDAKREVTVKSIYEKLDGIERLIRSGK